MEKTVEEKKMVMLLDGRITRTKILDEGKSVEIYYIPDNFEENFPVIPVSTLSLKDDFLKHEPETETQKRLKDSIVAGIREGLKDFRRPIIDPSFDENKNIVYKAGTMPAVGDGESFGYEEAKKFMPEKNSRMGTLRQYDAFLGFLIKYLMKQGFAAAGAWERVCDDSRELGHYSNSENAKNKVEPTGSRKIWDFYDLANVPKIVQNSDSPSGFSLVSGFYNSDSKEFPLAENYPFSVESQYEFGTPWIVLDV